MGSLSDFNDLHIEKGLDCVRDQLLAAISPVPPIEEGPPTIEVEFTIENLLNRFALISGTTMMWDFTEQRRVKKSGLIELIGKDLYKEWSEHSKRRVVLANELAAFYEKGRRGNDTILERYVYVYPSREAWDNLKKELIPLESLRVAIPNEYDWWLKNPDRRQIDHDCLVFDPTQTVDPETHINTFTGLKMKPLRGERYRCDTIRQLLDSLCNHRDEVIEWVTKWLAYPLQNIGAKLDTALLFNSSIHGTGKSMLFADICCSLYKPYSAVLGQHQLESQYTDWRSRLLFAVFEEIFSRDQKYSHVGTVKHMITGKTQRIEKKFISGWEEANHMNAIFLSNEFQPFPIEPSDRRMLVVWPENPLAEDLQWLVSEDMDRGGIEAFFDYLLMFPMGDFNRHTKPLMTPEKERLIDFGLPSQDVFYKDWVSGALDAPYTSCIVEELYVVYERWCRKAGERALSRKKFSSILSTREDKGVRWYYERNFDKKQRTFFLVGDKPDGKTEMEWLGECVKHFREEAQIQDGDSSEC